MTISVCVGTADFRKALTAVRPHADKTKTGGDGTTILHRVRVVFGIRWAYVMATNITTTAIARVDLVDEDGTPVQDVLDRADDQGNVPPSQILDLLPRQALRILTTFPVTKAERDGFAQVLSIEADANGVDIEDIAGLVAGDGLHLAPVTDGGGYPDVWGIVGAALESAQMTPHIKPLTSAHAAYAAFNAAGAAYEQAITISPTGTADSRGFVVEVPPRFVGTIESRHNDDDSLSKRDQARRDWLNQFAGRQLAVC